MVQCLSSLMKFKRCFFQVPLIDSKFGEFVLSHRRWKPFFKILSRHRERLLRRLRSWSMEFLVVVAVERDAVLRDVHEKISPVRETVVHLLQRMHNKIHGRVQVLVDRKFADEPVIKLQPIIDALRQTLVVDDDEQIKVGQISLCGMGLIDPAAAGIAAIQDNFFDPPFLLPLLLGERQCILEFLENDLYNALQFALLIRGEMVQVGTHDTVYPVRLATAWQATKRAY